MRCLRGFVGPAGAACAVLAALMAFAGPVGVASAASAAPTVTGATTIGGTLTATGDGVSDDFDWYTCSGATLGSQLATDTATYTVTLADAGSDICAEEEYLLGSSASSAPVGPVGGLPAGAGPVLGTTGAVTQGETLTVARQGAWGAGATVTDAWQDCDVSGGGCTPVASRATGTSYTVARSDAGHTLEVVETAIAGDGARSSATTAATGVATATAPVETSAPSVSGTAKVGDTLTAATGTWTNDPTAYTFAWYRCALGSCTDIRGANARTYVVTSADEGSTLEVLVDATALSSSGQAYPSAPSAIVAFTSAPGSHNRVHRGRHRGSVAHVAATMLWTFHYAPVSTQVLALDVEAAPLGARITERCAGLGCPFSTNAETVRRARHCGHTRTRRCRPPGVIDLEARFRDRHLHSGTVLTITITRAGEVGRYYRFAMRARRQPTVRISCLAPGGVRPGRGCTVS